MTQRPSVLIIVENLSVPFDRRVWQEARALREAGYRVSIICPKGKGFDPARSTSLTLRLSLPSTSLREAEQRRSLSVPEPVEGRAPSESRRAGAGREILGDIAIYCHRLWEASGPLGYPLEYAWALVAEFWLALKIYARTRFRILHACNPPDTIFLIGLFFKIFGVRFLFDHHDLNPELYEAKFGKRRGVLYRLVCLAERLTFRTADVSIATNKSYRDVALTRGGMRPERVFIVRSCPDLKNIQRGPAQLELKQGKPFLVVYLGVMGPQEGLDLLLESVEFVVKQQARDDVLFVFIGGGTELPRVQARAVEKGLEAVVKFTGRIPDEELAAYLSTADVCAAPDPKNPMNDKSTMNKILEYMAYGRPVVLYDLTEGRRSAGDAALYARPNDPVDFAQKILQLLDSESLRRQLGERGRKRIEEELNWEVEKQALLAAYATALK